MSSDGGPEPAPPLPAPAGGHREAGPPDHLAATPQEFRDFLEAEYDLLVRFVMRAGASLPDAEDAVQHTAMQGWRTVQRGQWHHIVRPRAWARKVALNHHRSQRDRAGAPLGPDTDPPAAGPGHAELTGQARDLIRVLRLLDRDCRAVIAFDLDDVPGADIAAALGMTPRRVRDLRAKARRQMRRHLALGGFEERP
ncbi:sigma-70 family RNA polymerase sigma factor [Spirillospora sp. CA-108201]